MCGQSSNQHSQRGTSKRSDKPDWQLNTQQQLSQQNRNCSSLQTDTEVTLEEFIISSIGVSDLEDSWFIFLHIDGVPVKFKVDTGAQCNVLPKQLFDSIVKTKRLQPGPRVTAYNRQQIKVVGQQRLSVVYNGNQLSYICDC